MGPEEEQAAPAFGTGGRRLATVLIARLRARAATEHDPLFVGIDGRSGVGKSTLTTAVTRHLAETLDHDGRATVIEGDDFYAGGRAAAWDRRTPADNAARVIDWRRQRDVIETLRRSGVARWRPFDWNAEDWDGDLVPLATVPTVARAAPVVILEGASVADPNCMTCSTCECWSKSQTMCADDSSSNAKATPTKPTGKPDGQRPRTTTSAPSCHPSTSISSSARPRSRSQTT